MWQSWYNVAVMCVMHTATCTEFGTCLMGHDPKVLLLLALVF
jgi:hypothetical protein